MIREANLNDYVKLENVPRDFSMPNPNNPRNIIQNALLDESGKVCGLAVVHATTEVSIILDGSIPRITRARLIKELFSDLIVRIKEFGYEDTHVFVLPETDVEYADFLRKNFSFVKASGIPMYWGCNLEVKNG